MLLRKIGCRGCCVFVKRLKHLTSVILSLALGDLNCVCFFRMMVLVRNVPTDASNPDVLLFTPSKYSVAASFFAHVCSARMCKTLFTLLFTWYRMSSGEGGAINSRNSRSIGRTCANSSQHRSCLLSTQLIEVWFCQKIQQTRSVFWRWNMCFTKR